MTINSMSVIKTSIFIIFIIKYFDLLRFFKYIIIYLNLEDFIEDFID